eukprot:g5753.t1
MSESSSKNDVLMDQLLKLSSILEKKESPLKMFKVIRKNVALRDLPKTRIKNVVAQHFPSDPCKLADRLQDSSSEMDVDSEENNDDNTLENFTEEMYVYLCNLFTYDIIRSGDFKQALEFSNEVDKYCSNFQSRRTFDILKAKNLTYLCLCKERTQSQEDFTSILLKRFRSASLSHDEFGKAVSLNLLTREYIKRKDYAKASALIAKTEPFPEISNNQLVRHLYYHGKIKTIQLKYTEAYKMLSQALRKVPQNTALGFRVDAQKLTILVQLLIGELPERSVFNQVEYRGKLDAYLAISQAVRVGDLDAFQRTLQKYDKDLEKDDTKSLVYRLRNNVLKTGLRRISISYSRISFQDIASKLSLKSANEAECVCAKAIRDGVVDAVLDHKQGFMRSKETIDTYSTNQPRKALHLRTSFCLDIHNEAVKAMRYPPDAFKIKNNEEEETKDEKDREDAKREAEEDEKEGNE